MEKLKIPYPILVEGKYDKIKLDSVVDALIITSEGFGIFKNDEKRALLRRLAKQTKIIVLSDSDSAGMLIRSCIKNTVPADRIINLYTPQICGKERRKDKPSKEGFVGVEGVGVDVIRKLLEPYSGEEKAVEGERITKTDFYEFGLSGKAGAAEMREFVCEKLELPKTLTPNALLEALNLFMNRDDYNKFMKTI